jgi:hypothetical protein
VVASLIALLSVEHTLMEGDEGPLTDFVNLHDLVEKFERFRESDFRYGRFGVVEHGNQSEVEFLSMCLSAIFCSMPAIRQVGGTRSRKDRTGASDDAELGGSEMLSCVVPHKDNVEIFQWPSKLTV